MEQDFTSKADCIIMVNRVSTCKGSVGDENRTPGLEWVALLSQETWGF